jgi:type IV pilus assembly protein PilM
MPNLNLKLGRRGGASVVGLDIQPGYVTAVQAQVNGSIVVRHAAGAPLAPDAIREGEVLDPEALTEVLHKLFQDPKLGRRVRVGVANQRTVLRMLELPPVADRKELAAAVRFQAEDQIPMPLASAVLDFHSLGVIDTPAGPRERVVVVAAQRDMIEKLLGAVRAAGLKPEGVDLSAFALIRSLYRRDPEYDGRVLYLNVAGLTNMAIAEGTTCRFTRVVGGGLEAMAAEIAERREVPLVEARELLATMDLRPTPEPEPVVEPELEYEPELELLGGAGAREDSEGEYGDEEDGEPLVDFHEGFGPVAEPEDLTEPESDSESAESAPESEEVPEPEQIETWALAQDPEGVAERDVRGASIEETPAEAQEPGAATPPLHAPSAPEAVMDAEARAVLQSGIRDIVGEVRNSLDFHRSQEGGGEVTSVVLSGPALDMPGFAEALEEELGVAVRREVVQLEDGEALEGISPHRLAVAAGLVAEEVPA